MEERTPLGRLRAQRDALFGGTAALAGEIAALEAAVSGFLSRREEAAIASHAAEASDASGSPDAPGAAGGEAAQCARLARDVCRLRALDGYARQLAADFEEKLLSLSDYIECALRERDDA